MPAPSASPSGTGRFWRLAVPGILGSAIAGILWLMILNFGVYQGLRVGDDDFVLGRLWIVALNSIVTFIFFLPISVATGLVAAWAMPRLAGRRTWRAAAFGAAMGMTLAILWCAGIAWGFYSRGEYRATADLWGRFLESLSDPGMIAALPVYAAWIALWRWRKWGIQNRG